MMMNYHDREKAISLELRNISNRLEKEMSETPSLPFTENLQTEFNKLIISWLTWRFYPIFVVTYLYISVQH